MNRPITIFLRIMNRKTGNRSNNNNNNGLGSTPVLGVDIGRVIIEGDGPDTNFISGSEAEALRAPAMEGAFAVLTRLRERFAGRVWLVSKCGPKVQARTRSWLDRHRFFQTTGIPYGHLRFCRDRKDKAPICEELGIGLFVDDRFDVLDAMKGIVPYRFQFGASSAPTGIIPVPTWASAEEAIAAALDGQGQGREALSAPSAPLEG